MFKFRTVAYDSTPSLPDARPCYRTPDLGWVPESVVARLRDVRVEGDSVVLDLVTGSRSVDRGNRVEILGRVDDVGVAEIVETMRRHGWASVTVQGDMDFRVAASKALVALEPPVRVEGSVLSEFEEAEIEDTRPLSRPRQGQRGPGVQSPAWASAASAARSMG